MPKCNKQLTIAIDVLTILLLLMGATLIISSPHLIPWLQSFLESKVFHRTFSMDRWGGTIMSLLAYPVFFAIVIDAVLFPTFSRKNRCFLLAVYLAVLSAVMIYAFHVDSLRDINSDLASEMFLAREGWERKSFWPTTWYYSTEIRLFNTQLISIPLFAFFSQLSTIRTLTAIGTCIVLFWGTWFVLHALGISRTWLKFFLSIVMVVPVSWGSWDVVQFGNYYVPHIVFSFVYLGVFFSWMRNPSRKKGIAVLALAFFAGLSSIRYLFIFVFPLTLVLAYTSLRKLVCRPHWTLKEWLVDDLPNRYGIATFLIGCFGYVCNDTVLRHWYKFSQWNTTAYTHIGDITFTQLHNDLAELLGYRNMVSALTPSGFDNVLVYVMIVYLVVLSVDFFRLKEKDPLWVCYIRFAFCSLLLTGFIYLNMDYYARYFVMTLALFIPVIGHFLDNDALHPLKRYVLGISVGILCLSSGFITLQQALEPPEDTSREEIAAFLEQAGYRFGYATFSHANSVAYLTNGTISIANLDKKKQNGVAYLLDHYKLSHWLTRKEYDDPHFGEGEPCFLLLDRAQYEGSIDNPVIAEGKLVYETDAYLIFEYADPATFRKGFAR